LPKEDDTVHTLKGKRIHEAMASGDFSTLPNKSERDIAARIAYAEGEIVNEYNFEGAEVEFEQRIWDFDFNLNKTWSMQMDRYDWQPDKRRLLAIDDKSGWTLVPPVARNWQIRSGGALLAEQLDALELVCALIHPFSPESLWEAKVYTRQESDALLSVTRHLVQQIQLPNQRRIVGGIQCEWCAAKQVCPEFIASEAALDQKVDDWIQDEGFTAINRQSPEERAETVRSLKQRFRNIEFVLDQYTELAKRDESAIQGYRLARKYNVTVANEATAMEIAKKEFGDEAMYSALKFSVAALIEEVQTKTRTGKKEAKAAVERVLGPLLQYKASKHFLEEARSA
jgi:hypothetical protein